MSRSGGYKCYNLYCKNCIGKSLCGEPGDTALSCIDRIVLQEYKKEEIMDYKELIENHDFSSPGKIADWIWNATCAITDLLSRAEKAEARAEKAERERDDAVKYIRHYGWCAGCKYFRGVRGCAGPGLKNCTEQSDYYEFGQKEE